MPIHVQRSRIKFGRPFFDSFNDKVSSLKKRYSTEKRLCVEVRSHRSVKRQKKAREGLAQRGIYRATKKSLVQTLLATSKGGEYVQQVLSKCRCRLLVEESA